MKRPGRKGQGKRRAGSPAARRGSGTGGGKKAAGGGTASGGGNAGRGGNAAGRAKPSLPATEETHPRAGDLARLDALGLVRRIAREDRLVAPAVAREARAVAQAARLAAAAISAGGRLVYVGAGTSGRLGVLDAAECPPTFGVDSGRVTAVLAGGLPALTRAREGAEDDEAAGARAMDRRRIGPRDVVLGITASGRTPFVRAALRRAVARGARAAVLCCSPPPAAILDVVDVAIQPRVGPEILAGSTRMKAGTATKLVLNQISTAAMILLGHVHEGRMVDLRGGSRKLRERAAGIVGSLAGVSLDRARELLRRAGGSTRVAVVMGLHGVGATRARSFLDRAGGSLEDLSSSSRPRPGG